MAEETGVSGGGNLSATLGRKVGPLPIYGWLMIAGGAGLILFRLKGGAGKASGQGGTGAGNQFSSQQSVSGTTPEGGQYSSSYSSQGNGYLPGQLSWSAGPMPTQGGDVYVNYPADTNTQPQEQKGVPKNTGKWASDGTKSLWQIAKENNTQPELIIWATSTSYQTTQLWNDYINNGRFNDPIPAGQLVYWPLPG